MDILNKIWVIVIIYSKLEFENEASDCKYVFSFRWVLIYNSFLSRLSGVFYLLCTLLQWL
jgi:hypothetical protein